MTDLQLWNTTKKLAQSSGIDLVGTADLTGTKEFVERTGSKIATSFPRGISLVIGLNNSIMDLLITRNEDVLASYDSHYAIVNSALDRCALLVAKHLEQAGYRAFPIPASQSLPPYKLRGHISHKLVAHLAGLGWIGKSCLLVTPEFGPRVRLVTVLTDAPLPAQNNISESKCGNCQACVKICPAGAFSGRMFDPAEEREVRFTAKLCQEYTFTYEKQLPFAHNNNSTVCGLCIHVCPYGLSLAPSN